MHEVHSYPYSVALREGGVSAVSDGCIVEGDVVGPLGLWAHVLASPPLFVSLYGGKPGAGHSEPLSLDLLVPGWPGDQGWCPSSHLLLCASLPCSWDPS